MNQKDQTLIRIGMTESHDCSYLDEHEERVAVVLDDVLHTCSGYELLMANGFRRSGNAIYKPQCDQCNACQSLRVAVSDFKPSKSQKRLLNKAKNVEWKMKNSLDDEWFNVYEQYIIERHREGSMYPPKKQDFSDFAQNEWLNTQFLHVYEEGKLIGVAVTDVMSNCASAFYTFYNPHSELSLGTLCVLLQLQYCQKSGKQWLYLGYQIDECQAMNYKVRFHPHQRLVNHRWQG
ncbi:arginyltransferase [Vibrio sp. vnigr-6D03]|uniref:arginyltransferase n=1 Tax=Vibrio sp. vnigr-6D03 TaxID=2058088 RepID=UPI000C31EEF7|nr:arginyltransferase [Vibrio sp. vnigr-6D03]PKF79626.1 arginyltransferase [Vibrio sp. vnigr-6D03]